ncbi:hypothetical protein QZN08_27115 [Burkholderia multivorans]|nr:hypothetical protein [Burkholderia multivorans]
MAYLAVELVQIDPVALTVFENPMAGYAHGSGNGVRIEGLCLVYQVLDSFLNGSLLLGWFGVG